MVIITFHTKLCQPGRYCKLISIISKLRRMHIFNIKFIFFKCYLASWYLSADTQLFFISPLLIYLVCRFKMKAFIALVGLILGSIGFTLALHVNHNLTDLYVFKLNIEIYVIISNLSSAKRNYVCSLHGNKMELAYVPTHVRFTPWLIGFIVGYILFEFPSGSIQIPKVI